MSHVIRNDVLKDLGELHHGRKRVQPASRDIRGFYERAKDALKFPLLTFAPPEFSAIADAFDAVIRAERYTCYACAIMPDHVHAVVRKHKHPAEEMIEKLQDESRRAVIDAGLRQPDHPVWGGPGWKVFLDSTDDVRRTVKYVEGNPMKARLPVQHHPFVVPYDGWPLRGRER
jgi:REP element-mobilizing transposase RayT